MKNQQFLLSLYFILSAIHILEGQFGQPEIAIYTKPTLLLLLAAWFFLSTKNNPSIFRNLIVGALLFSFGGDTLLMFVSSRGEQFFLFGLVSFLIAHLFYLSAFYKYKPELKGWLKTKPLVALPLLFILLGFNYYLIPNVAKEMQFPILVYSLVIMMMVFSVLNLGGKIDRSIFQTLLAGALLFMFSDMIIAVNKFKAAVSYSHLAVMLTYLLGQYLIAKASVELSNKE